MEQSQLILGIVKSVDPQNAGLDAYEVIQNGQVYDEVKRLDTALNILNVLLGRRIELETRG